MELNRLEVSSRFTEVKGLPEEAACSMFESHHGRIRLFATQYRERQGELALLTCIPVPYSRCSSSINVRTTFPFLLGIDTWQGGSDTLGK
jgi:hypothetical protein